MFCPITPARCAAVAAPSPPIPAARWHCRGHPEDSLQITNFPCQVHFFRVFCENDRSNLIIIQ
jgi:hypothetical protein